jgi:hypothetical protein
VTREEWLAAVHPQPMLNFLGAKASPRKLRLFAAACCRRAENLLVYESLRRGVNVAERLADGHVSARERKQARAAVFASPRDLSAAFPPGVLWHQPILAGGAIKNAVAWALTRDPMQAALFGSPGAADARAQFRFALEVLANEAAEWRQYLAEEHAAAAGVLRDVFGPLPFRQTRGSFLPAAQCADTVRAIAHVIYEERRFSDLPILADALEETGCTDDEILAHCRGGGEHALGCWCVDLALGKE